MRNTLIISLFAILTFAIVACGGNSNKKEEVEEAAETTTEEVVKEDNNEAKTENNDTGEKVMVLISTNKGDIKIALDKGNAPITVENFISYVKDGFYNDTIFHRVIPNFMVQGGGFSEDMNQKPTKDPIKNEADNGLTNERGTVAMARTSVVDSATSQFFINLVDNGFLNHGARDFGYAVFGKVVDGMDIVDEIGGVPTGNAGPFRDVPKEPVIIKSVTVVE